MKVLPIIVLTSVFFSTSACQSNKIDEDYGIDSDKKQIIFFSDETNYQLEAAYYDAIIELKQSFPEEVKNMMTLSPTKAENYYERFEVKECPTLLVIYGDEIIVRVDGGNSKTGIIEPISTALSKE